MQDLESSCLDSFLFSEGNYLYVVMKSYLTCIARVVIISCRCYFCGLEW